MEVVGCSVFISIQVSEHYNVSQGKEIYSNYSVGPYVGMEVYWDSEVLRKMFSERGWSEWEREREVRRKRDGSDISYVIFSAVCYQSEIVEHQWCEGLTN